MPPAERTLLRVAETRMRDGKLEGLCVYSDGSQEWKPPAKATVEIVNDRTGEAAEVTEVKIGGVACA